MNKKTLLILVCLLLVSSSLVYGHGMILELEKPGVLKAQYDGGGFSPRTEITIYDEKDEELGKGIVDEEGRFHFDKNLDVYKAIAEDGMGHKAEYKKGAITRTIPKLPVVVGVFGIVGIIYMIYSKKPKQKKAV